MSVPDYDTWKPRRKIYDPAFNKRLSAMQLGGLMLQDFIAYTAT